MQGSVENKSLWRGTSLKKLKQWEEAMKELSGLDPSEIKSYPVYFTLDQDYENIGKEIEQGRNSPENSISYSGSVDVTSRNTHKKQGGRAKEVTICHPLFWSYKRVKLQTTEFIMTYELGDSSNPQIVLVHGYGGSALWYFKLFKRLKQKYHVIMIDLLGKGSSSRPEFLPSTKDEAEIFHLQAIEKWRQEMKIEKMILIGHSFGGYLCARYAIQHPETISKLILWSPLGAEPEPEGYEQIIKQEKKESSWIMRPYIKFYEVVVNKEYNPFNFVRLWGRLGGFIIKRYINRKFPDFTKEQKRTLYEYFYQITMMRGSGEYTLYKIMKSKTCAITPFYEHLETLKSRGIQVSFVYGDGDWLDTEMAQVKISQKLREDGYQVDILKDWGHHFFFEDAEALMDTLDRTIFEDN